MCVGVCMCVFFQKFGKVAIFVYAHIRRFSGIISKSTNKKEKLYQNTCLKLYNKKNLNILSSF